MQNGRKIAILAASAILFSAGRAFPQTPPPSAKAGVVEKELKKEALRPRERKELPVIKIDIPLEKIELPEDKKVLVKGFEFEGNTVVKRPVLTRAVSKYLGKELSLAELQKAADAVMRVYTKKGYVMARAYLPPQDIKDNVVRIAIVEGRLGRVIIEKGKFYSEKFIRRFCNLTDKGVINYNKIIGALLIFNDYPDLKVKVFFRKGVQPYTTDVVVKVEDKFPFHAGFDYNNFGSRYISSHRFGFNMEYSSLILEGDKLAAREVFGSPPTTLQFEDVNYSVPVDYYGTRAAISYTRGDFNVQREYRSENAFGASSIYGVQLSHPVVKTLASSVYALIGFDYKDIQNYQTGNRTSNDQLRVMKAGVTGDNLDNVNGRNYFGVIASWGLTGTMGASTSESEGASRSNAGGKFLKLNCDAARLQKFILGSYILMKASTQFSANNLTTPEQFFIGGADSVRGYPIAEYLGDYGYSGTFELRMPLPYIGDFKDPITHKPIKDSVQLLSFMDLGQVYNKKPLPSEDRWNFIIGAGVGLRVKFTDNINVRLDVGFPVGGKKPTDGSHATTYIQTVVNY